MALDAGNLRGMAGGSRVGRRWPHRAWRRDVSACPGALCSWPGDGHPFVPGMPGELGARSHAVHAIVRTGRQTRSETAAAL